MNPFLNFSCFAGNLSSFLFTLRINLFQLNRITKKKNRLARETKKRQVWKSRLEKERKRKKN